MKVTRNYHTQKLTSSTVLRDSCFAATSAGMSIGGGDGDVLEDISRRDDLSGKQNHIGRPCKMGGTRGCCFKIRTLGVGPVVARTRSVADAGSVSVQVPAQT